MTTLIKSPAAWRKLREGALKNKTAGFVPTMGALHEGHVSLVRRSKRENDITLVSIFVNPTQFNDKKDLAKYPRALGRDMALLEKAGADYLLAPSYNALYPDDYRYKVSENKLSGTLCGAFRPGHFYGVLTVVLKLLNIAGAQRAYFGEKDYQQYLLVKGMAEAFFLKTKIVPCPTVREQSGLAMSSRNRRLEERHLALAPELCRALRGAGNAAAAKKTLQKLGFAVDYVEDRFGRRFAAAKLGDVRLIDNVKI
ncbi:MAG: pantoate--beta-alanine ligase [Elusimicrobiales bacterium]